MGKRIQLRRDTAVNWTSQNPLLSSGEIGYETDTGKMKIGTGTTRWTSLTYQSLPTHNHDEAYEAKNANIQAHISSTSNPHTVTKAQVGLTNVTDDAQLKIASNLSDLNNAATARTNLGLGSGNTPTFAGINSPTATHTVSGLMSYTDKLAFDETKRVLNDKERWYLQNTKMVDYCINANYTSVSGTQSAETSNLKVGSEALRVLENDNTGSSLTSIRSGISLNLAKFNDGSASSTSDVITVCFFVSDVNAVNYISLYLKTDLTNYFVYSIYGLATGYNYIDLPKSSFTATNSPTWSSITEIEILWRSYDNRQDEYVSYNYIQLVRKDPSSAAPNPFQYNNNGTRTRDYEIITGNWFVGEELSNIVFRDLDTSDYHLLSASGGSTYTNFTARMKAVCANTGCTGFGWTLAYGGADYISTVVRSDLLYVVTQNEGTQSVSCSVSSGDIIEYVMRKSGTIVSVEVYKNNSNIPVCALSGTFTPTDDGYLYIVSEQNVSSNIIYATIEAS
jgi:hypothetical protein